MALSPSLLYTGSTETVDLKRHICLWICGNKRVQFITWLSTANRLSCNLGEKWATSHFHGLCANMK